MALLSPGIIGGLAAGFQGDQMLQELLAKKLQVQAGQRAMVKDTQATTANDIWSKAIMDVLSANQQGVGAGISAPVAPQPGQVSLPMTQGSAGVPAQAAPGGAPPAAPGASPGDAGGAPAPDPTLAMLGAPGPAPAPAPAAAQPTLPSDPMDASTLLANIQAQNPGMEAGVLSSIVNDHLMPLLSTQAQAQYKQFQQQLDVQKMRGEQQDRMNNLYFKYDQLQQRAQDKALDRDQQAQLHAASNAVRGEIADMRRQMYEEGQPLRDAQLAETQARVDLIKAQTQKAMNAQPTGGAAVTKLKGQASEIRDMAADAIRLINQDPMVVGAAGMGKRIWQAGMGWVDPTASTTATDFQQKVLGIQDRINKMVSGGYMTAAKAARLNNQIRGLSVLDNPVTAKSSLTEIFNQADEVYKNPSAAIGGTPSETQVPAETSGTSGGAGSSSDTPLGTVKTFDEGDGKTSKWKKSKAGSDLDQGNWTKQ